MTSTSVLVTGGGGFIGTWVLRELLSLGLRPIVFDLQKNDERWRRILGADAAKVEFVAGNLHDRDRMQRIAVEKPFSHIIHLAALLTPDCQKNPYVGCEVNVLGSVALFELARMCAGQIKGISYASSYAVFGPEVDDDPILKLKAVDNCPPTFYGAFKLAMESIAEQYWRHFNIRSVGIRPHVVYGPERTVGLTAGPSQAVRAAAMGQQYTIAYKGRLGYDYIEDVARAFVRSALETPQGSNVVDLPSRLATTEEFVSIIERVLPGASKTISVDGPTIPSNISSKPRFISELFPDFKTTTLEEGIRLTADFYQLP